MTHQIGGCTLHPLRGTYSIGVFKSSLVPISLGLVLLLSFLCSHVPRAYASPHPRSYSYPIQLSNGTSGPTTASTYPNTRISTSMNAGSPIQKRVEGDEFDFVIVGGGTAGLVIAERCVQYFLLLFLFLPSFLLLLYIQHPRTHYQAAA